MHTLDLTNSELLVWSAEGTAKDARAARSAPDGSFELPGLPAGVLWLTARGAGYKMRET